MKAAIQILTFIFIAAICSCQKELPNNSGIGVFLTDGPGPYKELNIDIRKVEIVYEDRQKGNNGAVAIATQAGCCNIISPNISVGKEIAYDHVALGKIATIRLTLGDHHSMITNDGDTVTLGISDENKEQVFVLNNEVSRHYNLQVELDFDENKSVVPSESQTGAMMLSPVVSIRRVGFH